MDENKKKYFWDVLVENLKGEIPPSVYPFLNNSYMSLGVLHENKLRIYTNSEFTKAIIGKPQIVSKISEIATTFFGRKTPVEITACTAKRTGE